MCYREFPCQRDLIRLGLGLGLGLGLALGLGLILTWPPGEKATKGRSTPGSLLATPPHAAASVPAEANGASLVPMPGGRTEVGQGLLQGQRLGSARPRPRAGSAGPRWCNRVNPGTVTRCGGGSAADARARSGHRENRVAGEVRHEQEHAAKRGCPHTSAWGRRGRRADAALCL